MFFVWRFQEYPSFPYHKIHMYGFIIYLPHCQLGFHSQVIPPFPSPCPSPMGWDQPHLIHAVTYIHYSLSDRRFSGQKRGGRKTNSKTWKLKPPKPQKVGSRRRGSSSNHLFFRCDFPCCFFFCIGGWYIFLGPFFVNCVFSWEKRKISDEWKKISESYTNMMILPTNSSGLGCFSNVEKCWDDSPYHFSFSLPKKCWSQCLGWFSPYQYDRPPGRFTWFTREIQKRPLGRGVIFSSKPNHHGIRFQWFIFRGVQ